MFRAAVLVALGLTLSEATYEPNAALVQLYLAGAAYCDQKLITTWSCGTACDKVPGVTQVTALYNNSADNGLADVYGYVGKMQDGSIVLSFRGTEGIRDWILDFDFVAAPLPNCASCELHEGFSDAWQALRGQALTAMTALGAMTAPAVYVTGHSLGAAIANIASYELATLGFPLGNLYNYGQPRTGNPAYAAAYQAKVTNHTKQGALRGVRDSPVTSSYRVVHAADPVPQLPPQALGYSHSPSEVWYYKQSDPTVYRVCEDYNGEDPGCSDSQIDLDPADHAVYLGIHISELCSAR